MSDKKYYKTIVLDDGLRITVEKHEFWETDKIPLKYKYSLKATKMDDRRINCTQCCFYNERTGCMCGEDREQLDKEVGKCEGKYYYIKK